MQSAVILPPRTVPFDAFQPAMTVVGPRLTCEVTHVTHVTQSQQWQQPTPRIQQRTSSTPPVYSSRSSAQSSSSSALEVCSNTSTVGSHICLCCTQSCECVFQVLADVAQWKCENTKVTIDMVRELSEHIKRLEELNATLQKVPLEYRCVCVCVWMYVLCPHPFLQYLTFCR